MLLPLDIETTGLFRPNIPFTDPTQPRLVAVSAAIVHPETFRFEQSMSKVVAPDGWDWDEESEAFKVHQITADYASKWGRSEKEVLEELIYLWHNECHIIAHNLDFERKVIACAIARHYGHSEVLRAWLAAPGTCTMLESKPIVKAQTKPDAKGRTRLKNPRLSEAYEHFMGTPLESHHSANADMVACLHIYLALQGESE